jgi:glycerol-1-phosphate dehydrogenase [NAD(P)+]
VTATHFEALLAAFGPGRTLACACGATHRLGVSEILLGDDALERSAVLLARQVAPPVWVLSDGNTEAAAGARWKELVRAAGGPRLAERVLPAAPVPVPTAELVEALAAEARAAGAQVVVAVGSGVLSDLGKAISRAVGVPNWAIATAASVDAYTSANAAIRVGGYHRSLPATPSEVVVADLAVLQSAPRRLFLDGLGDLLGKYLAHLDWTLAHDVNGDAYCDLLAGFALGSARQALAAAELAAEDPRAATLALGDATLTSGLCMQGFGSSRPAAAAEHTVAHFWEMAGAVGVPEHDLHGILVGAASRLVLAGYRRLYPLLARAAPDPAARRAALEAEPRWDAALPAGLAPYRGHVAHELAGREADGPAVEARIRRFTTRREALVARAEGLLGELAEAVETLARLGFPFAPATLGLREPELSLGVRYARLLRNRYTSYDLAHDLGLEDQLVAGALAGVG